MSSNLHMLSEWKSHEYWLVKRANGLPAWREVHDGTAQETCFNSRGEAKQEASNKSTWNHDIFLHEFRSLKNMEVDVAWLS